MTAVPPVAPPPPAAAPPGPPTAPPRGKTSRTSRPPVLHRPTVLRGVAWGTYRALREDPGSAHVKLTYDGPAGGLLEIEMPQGLEHESLSRLLFRFVVAFAEVRGLRCRPVGSVTQSRQDLERGLEGDESFYLKSAPRIRGKRRLDLAGGDPPPDLSVEVDITSPGVAKLPIYAALGVPEVWVWRGDTLTCRVLTDAGEYEEAAESRELPGFPLAHAAELAARWADGDPEALVAELVARLS